LFRQLNFAIVHGTIALLLGVTLLLSSANTNLTQRLSDFSERALRLPEFPAFAARRIVAKAVFWFDQGLNLKEELEVLRDENVKLKVLLAARQGDVKLGESDILTAEITLRRPEDWWEKFRINKGSKEGIRPGFAVLNNGFLVGRVYKVSAHQAWVRLLTGLEMMVPAVVSETRDLGVVAGDGKGSLRLLYIPSESPVASGMNIETALVNEYLPAGLPIGTVGGVLEEKDGYSVFVVKSKAQLSRMYQVQIYIPSGGEK